MYGEEKNIFNCAWQPRQDKNLYLNAERRETKRAGGG
jgi:hypothetical protein